QGHGGPEVPTPTKRGTHKQHARAQPQDHFRNEQGETLEKAVNQRRVVHGIVSHPPGLPFRARWYCARPPPKLTAAAAPPGTPSPPAPCKGRKTARAHSAPGGTTPPGRAAPARTGPPGHRRCTGRRPG